MTKKHEAANTYIGDRLRKLWIVLIKGAGDKTTGEIMKQIFLDGWTQALEEVMKMAREKVVQRLPPPKYRGEITELEEAIKLSDLEAIMEELGK